MSGSATPWGSTFADSSPWARMPDFLLGACAALVIGGSLQARRGDSTRSAAPGNELRPSPLPLPRLRDTALELCVLAVAGAAIVLAPRVPIAVVRSAWFTPVYAAIIVTFAFGRGQVSQLLRRRVPQALGELSYSFFLWHWLVYHYLVAALPTGSDELARAGLTLAVSLGLSWATFHLLERPARRAINTRYARRTHAAMPPAAADAVDAALLDRDHAA